MKNRPLIGNSKTLNMVKCKCAAIIRTYAPYVYFSKKYVFVHMYFHKYMERCSFNPVQTANWEENTSFLDCFTKY